MVRVEGESRLIGSVGSAAHGRAADKIEIEIELELWLGIGTTRASSTSRRHTVLLDFLTPLRDQYSAERDRPSGVGRTASVTGRAKRGRERSGAAERGGAKATGLSQQGER